MNSSDYNRFLHDIETANDIRNNETCRQVLRKIYADMCSLYGPSENDVEHLYRKFRVSI